MLVESLAIRRRALGEDHLDVARGISKLGVLYRETGRADEAEPMNRRALAVRQNQLPADHPSVLLSMAELGLTLGMNGRYGEGESLLLRVYRTVEDEIAALRDDSDAVNAALIERRRRSLRQTAEWLTELYERWGKPEMAERYRGLRTES